MNDEPKFIASLILANPAAVSRLSALAPGDLRIELWHIVADIAGTRYRDAPVDAPMPDINALTDAITSIVAAALESAARTG